MGNVVAPIWDHAVRHPEAVALRSATGGREERLTAGELTARSGAFARRLVAAGVHPGDRVLLVAPTGIAFVVAYLGILASGATAVTVNTQCTAPELGHFLDDARCTLAIAHDEHRDAVARAGAAAGIPVWSVDDRTGAGATVPDPADVVARAGDDLAVLLYTSGTTGKPKGAMLGHGTVGAAVRCYESLLGISADDRLGTALPLFHVFGQISVMLTALVLGAPLSLLRPFTGPALLRLAADHRLTIVSGVPTMWIEMLRAGTPVGREDLTALRLAASGGAALPQEIGRAFAERFGVEILDGYGLSETSAAGTFTRPGRPARAGSVGQALPGLEIALLDESGVEVATGTVGEVAIRGPVVFQGYWGRPEATREVLREGWFRTGDLARADDDGYLWIVDRTKDVIIRGGYNVYPREVEELLYTYPGVHEAAVIGIPDERLGEEVAAVLVPVAGAGLDPEQVRAWLADRLASYKQPRLYQVTDALPRNGTGKILKRAIDRDAVLAGARRVRRA